MRIEEVEIRLQLNQIKKASPQALLDKQRDYQDLRNEVLKVIQGASRLNADLLNSLIEETGTELKDLATQIQAAETELQETISNAERTRKEYTQLKNWASLYDNCTFEAKKMIVSQFVKAVRVHRGYELDIEFNVTFEEFRSLYLEPETPEQERTTTKSVLCLA